MILFVGEELAFVSIQHYNRPLSDLCFCWYIDFILHRSIFTLALAGLNSGLAVHHYWELCIDNCGIPSYQIEIRELDEFAQAAFQGYKSLNRVQSRIFQATYYTNENILVCS
jgi:hypothetical protein